MELKRKIGGAALALLAAVVLAAGGCKGDRKAESDTKKDGKPAEGQAKGGKEETKHDEWWCKEHGIPEDECSMCSAKVEKESKAKGDWCAKHERALSQCFICNPKRQEFYAAKYRAKYGKEPPPIEDEPEAKKKDDKQ